MSAAPAARFPLLEGLPFPGLAPGLRQILIGAVEAATSPKIEGIDHALNVAACCEQWAAALPRRLRPLRDDLTSLATRLRAWADTRTGAAA